MQLLFFRINIQEGKIFTEMRFPLSICKGFCYILRERAIEHMKPSYRGVNKVIENNTAFLLKKIMYI